MRTFGTWDFKWPQGYAIRVAFQELPEGRLGSAALEGLIASVEKIAALWTAGGANIRFDFGRPGERRLMPAPKTATSPAHLPTVDSREPAANGYVDYDVLVSFAPLPLVAQPPPRLDGTIPPAELVRGQLSVLGSYARRAEYGRATTLLGPNRNAFPEGRGGDGSLMEYFRSRAFEFITSHEIGHVLGLAHAHQNPLYRRDVDPKVKNDDRIAEVVEALRVDLYTRFFPDRGAEDNKREIDLEIRKTWPAADVSGARVAYSDWLPAPAGIGRLEEVSVMAHPGWSAFLSDTGAPVLDLDPKPRALDRQQLLEMYPSAL